MNYRKTLLTIGLGTLLSGCTTPPYTEAPIATNFPYAKQQKLQAAHHWQIIADRLGKALDQQLRSRLGCQTGCPPLALRIETRDRYRKDLHIQPSLFERALENNLSNTLIRKGWSILTPSDTERFDAVTVSIDTQVIRLGKRFARQGDQNFSFLTALNPILWVIDHNTNINATSSYEASRKLSTTMFGATFAATVAYDYYQWKDTEIAKGGIPKLEIQIHIKAAQAGKYIAQTSQTYYIDDPDFESYIKVVKEPTTPLSRVISTKE